jgi:hypothetical protein
MECTDTPISNDYQDGQFTKVSGSNVAIQLFPHNISTHVNE